MWHEDAVEPIRLARTLRNACFLGGHLPPRGSGGRSCRAGLDRAVPRRGRAAARLLGRLAHLAPEQAGVAVALLRRLRLSFYVANPEEEYKFTNLDGTSAERWNRSLEFARSFRQFTGAVRAAVSSYCRADQQDLDWKAWADRDFAFLPQAYVNQYGMPPRRASASAGRAGSSRRTRVHPTIGTYQSAVHGADGRVRAAARGVGAGGLARVLGLSRGDQRLRCGLGAARRGCRGGPDRHACRRVGGGRASPRRARRRPARGDAHVVCRRRRRTYGPERRGRRRGTHEGSRGRGPALLRRAIQSPGLPPTAVAVQGPGRAVFFYGTCVIPAGQREGGCAVPVQVQSLPVRLGPVAPRDRLRAAGTPARRPDCPPRRSRALHEHVGRQGLRPLTGRGSRGRAGSTFT